MASQTLPNDQEQAKPAAKWPPQSPPGDQPTTTAQDQSQIPQGPIKAPTSDQTISTNQDQSNHPPRAR